MDFSETIREGCDMAGRMATIEEEEYQSYKNAVISLYNLTGNPVIDDTDLKIVEPVIREYFDESRDIEVTANNINLILSYTRRNQIA